MLDKDQTKKVDDRIKGLKDDMKDSKRRFKDEFQRQQILLAQHRIDELEYIKVIL